MALIGLVGGVALVTVAVMVVLLRLSYYRMTVDGDGRRPEVVEWLLREVIRLYQLGLLLLAAAEFWPGLAAWSVQAWTTATKIA